MVLTFRSHRGRTVWYCTISVRFIGYRWFKFWFEKNSTDGFKKLGPKATLADAAQDKEIMKMLSDSEAQEVIQKLKPVIDGEQEFLLRAAKGPKQKNLLHLK